MSATALQALVEQVQAAGAEGRALRIRGGGSKDFYGNAPRGAVLETRPYTGIVAHEPSELVVTARCGTPLAALEAALLQHGQMLGFEPPNHGGGATVGGCVAAGLAGPARMATGFRHGGVRDAVLGLSLLDGRGLLLRFGGTVLKNVAGYDVSRLLAGSLGALGVITEVSLKVLPLPAAEATLQFELPERAALQLLGRWQSLPLPITATSWHDGRLRVRLAGAQAAVRSALEQLGGERLADDEARGWWLGLRHQTHAFFSGHAPLWRVSLPFNASPLELGAASLLEWNGMQRWLRSAAEPASIRARALQLGGHAMPFRRCPDGQAAGGFPCFAPLAPALLALHRRLRAVFDPAGVFDFGRLVTEA